MAYALGVDLGTTYTAAATHRDGRTSMVDLGNRSAAIPSVVFLREDEAVLTGDAASRRGATEPARVAREFKRRVGDTTPILLGGTPYSADALMSKLLRWVVDAVTEREGEAPAHISVSHPANWGPYKKDLLHQAIARADLDHVTTVTEPEAAVTYYASQERVEPGSIVAVYDLGGGTFDAAVVRKTVDGVELLGTPEGIERLGGIDFDEAVFSHVVASLGGALGDLDPDDPSAMAAVARLRSECVDAKEALSADTEVSIPVMLPNLTTEVRLTRNEFEAMIRPTLADSMTSMKRALRSAGIEPQDLHAVLLAGGSSRIPLVSQMVSAELGRPVAVDSHPKHGVAMGAAQGAAPGSAAGGASAAAAAGAAMGAGAPAASTPPVPPPPPAPVQPAQPAPQAQPAPPPQPPPASVPPVTPPQPAPQPVHQAQPQPQPAQPQPAQPQPQPAMAAPGGGGTWTPGDAPTGPGGSGSGSGSSKLPLVIGGVVAALVLAAVGWFVLGGDDDDGGDDVATGATAPDDTAVDPTVVTAPDTTTDTEPEVPASACDDVGDGLCIDITDVSTDGDSLVVEWDTVNFDPSTDDNHAHFFWDTTAPEEAGNNAGDFGATPGVWELTADQPFVSQDNLLLSARPDGATQVCVVTADSGHNVVDPEIFHCVDLPI